MAARPATAETIEAKLTILMLEGTVESYSIAAGRHRGRQVFNPSPSLGMGVLHILQPA